MPASEETIREELDWKETLSENNVEKLERDLEPRDETSALSRLGKALRGNGICRLLLGDGEAAREKFAESVERYLSFNDAIIEYADELPGGRQAKRPTHYEEATYAALLSGDDDLIRRAIRYPLELDEDRYLEEWGHFDFHYVLYFVEALAHTLDDDPETARSYLAKLDEVDHDFENFDALGASLRAILDGDREAFVAGLPDLLAWHDDAYGDDLSTATHFVSVDATAMLVLARREGLDVGPADFDEELRAYLPEALFE